jgi:hypothetical protein
MKKEKPMEIFNLIRGHFALLIGKPMNTPAKEKPFIIEAVGTKEGDWQLVLKISTGNLEKVYISDLLRVYAYIVSNYPNSLSQAQIDKFMKKNCVTQRTSYVIPLLDTFLDIKIEKEPNFSIRFIPPKDQ